MDGRVVESQRPDPVVMGIVNVTPDSFSDGGDHADPGRAIAHGLRLYDEGAAWLDIGGESTRPGASPVPPEVEAARVVPVVMGLARQARGAVLSVDTSKASVARAAIDAGATVVNDVSALADPAMGPWCAAAGVTVVLMHMRGRPDTMQRDTGYVDVVEEVRDALSRAAARAREHGIAEARIVLDPGLGFGKDPRDNPRLIANIQRFAALGYPILIGASRKRFIGDLTGVERPRDRVAGSIGAALAAWEAGAAILRVHDVGPTCQALAVYRACRGLR